MNRFWSALNYGFLAIIIVMFDRLSKIYALAHCVEPCQINRFVTLECVFNRGISWGILSSEQNIFYLGICLLITSIIIIMLIHSYRSWQRGTIIIGEVMVIAGALSNLVDRVFYRGVVDFIRLSYHSWAWPNFNAADVSIVIGVCLMLMVLYKES